MISQVLLQQGVGVKCQNDPGFPEQVDNIGLGYAMVDRVPSPFQGPFRKLARWCVFYRPGDADDGTLCQNCVSATSINPGTPRQEEDCM